jgi:hypothetical protein
LVSIRTPSAAPRPPRQSQGNRLQDSAQRPGPAGVPLGEPGDLFKKYEYCRNNRGYSKAVTCQLHFPHGHRINGYANLLLNGTSYGDSDEFHFTS